MQQSDTTAGSRVHRGRKNDGRGSNSTVGGNKNRFAKMRGKLDLVWRRGIGREIMQAEKREKAIRDRKVTAEAASQTYKGGILSEKSEGSSVG